ncbi:ABC transporter permease [Aeromicrobium wangtongii]|uniref:ABC transporter permease n=1 Tax=Aeromicrobium wangtongii TaxID=2969247 RepID=A0ABY5M6H1_9ACTN|nr:ABC transporter permease [Aeromicrobium wangtongii]MCD9198642.1 ABC transporter permease [Aeromicrobium wangtongii]UUP12666.1 ABC transporter permease [Aeromicrobium wangtongii]
MTTTTSLAAPVRPRRRRRALSARLVRARLLAAAPITVVVSMVTFWLASLSPFDPLAAYLGSRFEKTSGAQRKILAEQLGVDDSWIAVWGRWAGDVLLHWDWGQSRSMSRPVSEVLAERLPYTLLLAGTGLLIAVVLSLLLGVRAAWRPGSWTDRFATGLAYSMQGIPPFVVGLLAISVFSIGMGLPAGGVANGGADPTATSIATHLILPASVLGLSQVPWLLLNVRSSVIAALAEDHVTAARSRGLPDRTVVWKHALPAALLPFVTVIGVRLPELVSGALLVETVFSWPGLASATVGAAVDGDFPLLAAVTTVTCLVVLIGSALADAVYLLVDPRIDDV